MSQSSLSKLSERMKNIREIVVVLSGKGGVGKSTTSCQLALSLAAKGHKVGVLDIDICGPSVPGILGISHAEIVQSNDGWLPVELPIKSEQGEQVLIKCMSIAFLLKSKDDAVIWRGPKKNAMIRQFLEDVNWGQLDYLIVDTPPGTSDEHITLAELLRDLNQARSESGMVDEGQFLNAVIVTTPQQVSMVDVAREITFCNKLNIPIKGIIENMSGYVCPCCKEITYIFGSGGGKKLSTEYNIPYLGSIPIEPELANAEDNGINFIQQFSDSVTAVQFNNIVNQLLN